jgi:hypothetical protein
MPRKARSGREKPVDLDVGKTPMQLKNSRI